MPRRQTNYRGRTTTDIYGVPPVSPSGEAVQYYDIDVGALRVSLNGGAYVNVPTAGAGGDTLTIGADVTLQRSAANVLTIPESVVVTNPTAAAIGLTVNAHATQSVDAFLVQSSAGADWLRVTSAGLVQVGTGVTAAYQLEVSGAVNDVLSSSIRLKNTNAGTTTGTGAGMTCESATSSGYLRAYHSGFTGVTAYADSFVCLAQSDAAHLILAAEAGTQEIRFRVPTTGQILSLTTALLTVAEACNFVFGTTTGTQFGTVGGAAGQKLAFWGAAPIVQPLLATGAAATADDIITALQNLGLCRQA